MLSCATKSQQQNAYTLLKTGHASIKILPTWPWASHDPFKLHFDNSLRVATLQQSVLTNPLVSHQTFWLTGQQKQHCGTGLEFVLHLLQECTENGEVSCECQVFYRHTIG